MTQQHRNHPALRTSAPMRRLDAASSYPGQLTLISGESFASLVAPFTVHKGMPQCCQSPPTHQP